MDSLKRYLVGGAVRDEVLGLPVKDRDWVVVGATRQHMLDLGFTQVGRDFPVFLHPRTREEYALARTERKRGGGHTGFAVDANPAVTLEQDLKRRDLTINAIAKTPEGEFIDPYKGLADLRLGVLRHVSPAFAEDPLRVFRVARFAAQLPGFEVAEQTLQLMSKLCASGEIKLLSPERVWQELAKALSYPNAARFFATLDACGGLSDWLPELRNKQTPMPARHMTPAQRFALLPLNAEEFLQLGRRLRAPKEFVQAARDLLEFGHLLKSLEPAAVCSAFEGLGVIHGLDRLQRLLALVELTDGQFTALLAMAREFKSVGLGHGVSPGPGYGEKLRSARIDWLAAELGRVT